MLLAILTRKKLLEHFTKRNCKKQIKMSLELKKKSKENTIKRMLNGKAMIISKTKIFSKTKILRRKSVSRIRFINYATKADLKNATGVYTSQFTKKVDLASLKSRVDKLDNGQLKNVPTKI